MAKNRSIEPTFLSQSGKGKLAFRALTLVAAILAAYGAFQFSYLQLRRSTNPEALFTVRPDDPVALSEHVLARARSDPTSRPGKSEAELAIASVKKAPLSSNSLWIAATEAEGSGAADVADALMDLAEKVSRRNTIVQLWHIERSVQKDDLAEAIGHYDAVLSVDPRLQEVLFPILAKAIAFQEVQSALDPYFAREVRWLPSFVRFAADHARIEDLHALVLPHARQFRTIEYSKSNAKIISRIAEERSGRDALVFAERVVPKFDRDAFVSVGFTPATTDTRLGSLAWTLIPSGIAEMSIGENGQLSLALQPGTTGIVARRKLNVQPDATYLFSHVIEPAKDRSGARLTWIARCPSAQNSMKLGEFVVPQSQGATAFSAEISVPSSCRLLRLNLRVAGPDSQLPARVELSQFALRQL